jgi:sigma-B regulation protein RsbQ
MLSWATARFRVVCFDLIGASTTDPALFDRDRYASLAGYVDDLMRILDQTKAGPCVYVGHSAGGMIGLKAGTDRPEMFEQLVLLNTSPCYLDDGDYVGGFDEQRLAEFFDAIRHRFRELAYESAPAMLGTSPDDPAVEEFASGILRMRPDIALSMALTFFRTDLRPELDRLRVPVLIVHSRNDPIVPMAAARYLHSTLARARLAVIDAPGHLPHLTAPDKVIAAIEPYLPWAEASSTETRWLA